MALCIPPPHLQLPNHQNRGTAVAILDEAYARGEINHDEYLQKGENLM